MTSVIEKDLSNRIGVDGIVRLDWQTDQVVRVFSAGRAMDWGLAAHPHDPNPGVKEVDGRCCLIGGLFLFDIKDDFAFDIDETVEVEVVVDRQTTDAFFYAYDRNGSWASMERIKLPPAEKSRWESVIFELKRARFAGRGAMGTDFWLGSIDAVRPYGPRPHLITVSSVKFKRTYRTLQNTQHGNFTLNLRDAGTGEPIAARIGLYDFTGRMPLPSDDAVPLEVFVDTRRQIGLGPSVVWPHKNLYVFYVDGQYSARVPAGTYDLIVSRGPEYKMVHKQISIEPDRNLKVTVDLERWTDMAAQGWYSGDIHVHIGRENPSLNAPILAQARAEDLVVSNLLQMGNPQNYYFRQYAFGPEGHYQNGRYVLVSGQEEPRTGVLGHVVGLNGKRYIRDDYNYFLHNRYAEEFHGQGALFGYVHLGCPIFGQRAALAIDVPLGHVDFVSILEGGTGGYQIETEDWYRYLNLGYKLSPVAGSDHPYVGFMGEVRNYVSIGGDFSVQGWFDGIKAGRSFVTNGPILTLNVAGYGMGDSFQIKAGEAVPVVAEANINPDLGRIALLELVINGEVVNQTSVNSGGAESLTLKHTLNPKESVWVAVRASNALGRTGGAHSSPVYIHVDGKPIWNKAKAPEIISAICSELQNLRDGLQNDAEFRAQCERYLEAEDWETWPVIWKLCRRLRLPLKERINKALKTYDELLERIVDD